ncbi:hypothetical protein Tco_0391845, partial [Tanacetum coccineum]
MVDMDIPADNVPAEQAHAVAPPTRTDDQILPLSKAFTASSMILAIYIQQFWDTMCFNSSTGLYSCQLDEQWCNTPKLGRSRMRVRGVLLHRSITQDVYRTTKKSFKTDTLDLT